VGIEEKKMSLFVMELLWMVAFFLFAGPASACRHSPYQFGFKLTALEVQFLIVFGEFFSIQRM
jgi:hypothetical protein